MEAVREQYQLHPYPPVSRFALPRRDQGQSLRYEVGTSLAYGSPASHRGIRILVAGAGTLEALVVAQMHPHAKEIVAVDLSEKSLQMLRHRFSLARWRDSVFRPFQGKRHPPIRTVCADLNYWEDGVFDYILASNVLHHTRSPETLLHHLSRSLSPQGILRMVTYPKASRIWMRETSEWLQANGLTPQSPDLRKAAKRLIDVLPESHPIRSCFKSHPEINTDSGLIDAFLNACENPLSPLEWREACAESGLELVAEGQTESSRSSFLDELLPASAGLDTWSKLQVLDDLLEVCANPVFLLKRGHPESSKTGIEGCQTAASQVSGTVYIACSRAHLEAKLKQASQKSEAEMTFNMHSRVRLELYRLICDADSILRQVGKSAAELIRILKTEVGPRVAPGTNGRILPGLSITEYDLPRSERDPETQMSWEDFEKICNAALGNYHSPQLCHSSGLSVPGQSLSQQARWLQARYGAEEQWIPVKLTWIQK